MNKVVIKRIPTPPNLKAYRGEIWTSPESGSVTSLQPESARPNGEGRTGGKRTDTPMERQIQDEARQRQRQAVRESAITRERLDQSTSYIANSYPAG